MNRQVLAMRLKKNIASILTFLVIVIIELLRPSSYHIDNPDTIFQFLIIFSVVLGGYFRSTFVTLLLSLWYMTLFYSRPDHPFTFDQANMNRLVVSYVLLSATAVVASVLVKRNERAVHERARIDFTRKLYRQKARALLRLRKTEQVKDEFISVASHELKTPLTSIKGFAYLLKKQLFSSHKLFSYVDKIDFYSDRMTKLVNDLLDVSKIQVGKMTIEKEVFNFDTLVKDIVTSVRIVNSGHKIILSGRTGVKVNADRFRIEQVLQNLLSNAIKYSPDRKKIMVKMAQINKRIQVSVKDYGVGIPKEKLAKIFERFYRANEISKKISGLGIGLYISQEIIKRHGGKIWVESKPGTGSTFYITLPIYTSRQ